MDGIKIFTMYLTGTATDALRKLCDNARDKAPASVTAVIGEAEGKTTLAVAVGKEAQQVRSAGAASSAYNLRLLLSRFYFYLLIFLYCKERLF